MENSRLKHNAVIASLLIPIFAIIVALPDTEQSIEILKNIQTSNMAGVSIAVDSALSASSTASLLSKNSKCLLLTQTVEYQSTDKKTKGEVTKLQQFLYNGKFLSLKPDGLFGFSSVAALKKYQAKSKVADVGYLDARTKKKIQTDTCTVAEINLLNKATADAKKARSPTSNRNVSTAKSGVTDTLKVTTTIVEMRDSKGNIINRTQSSVTDGGKAALNGKNVSSSKTTSAAERVILSSEKLDPKSPFKVLYPQGYEKIEPLKNYGIQWSARSVSARSNIRIALVNVKSDEIARIKESSLVDTTTLDLSSLYPGARAITSDISGIPSEVRNSAGFTWSVPSGITSGTGYRIYVGNTETGEGILSEENFWISALTPKILKTRVSKIPSGYLVNISGENFTKGLSVRFSKNGKTLLDISDYRVQVVGSTQIQFMFTAEDLESVPVGGLYSVSVFDSTAEVESATKDIAFWQ